MIKNLFISAAAFGLIINLYSDIAVYEQKKMAIESGRWVEHSRDVISAINATRVSVFESEIQKVPQESLSANFEKLSKLVDTIPTEKKKVDELAQLSPYELIKVDHNPALSLLNEILSAELALLDQRLLQDKSANASIANETFFTNGLDIVLIFLFIGFFIYERRNALKLQSSISRALLQVETSYQQLQMVLATKNDRLKTIVHDLKNPLGSIRGFAELIYDGTNKDSVAEMANIIQRVSNSTLELVGSILDEKNENSSVKKAVNVKKCLADSCMLLGPVAAEKRQVIKFEGDNSDLVVLGSEKTLQDVFFNLIGNALKFSPKDSKVLVSFSRSAKYFEIRIRDQGPGFTAADFSKLFKNSTRLSAKPTGNETSTGIGLYSAKKSLENFNALIEVANNLQVGACITIKFPSSLLAESTNTNLLF